MIEASPTTSLARLSPWQARATLLTWAAFTALCIGVSTSSARIGYADRSEGGPGDIALYNAEAARVRAGENYYDAAAQELRQRGYPTSSVFNWRAPLPVWLAGKLPGEHAARCCLCIAAVCGLLFSYGLIADEAGVRRGLGCTLLLMGAWLPCALPEVYLTPELWSGLCIALSLVALARDRWRLGVALGLAALLLREFAAAYCGVMLLYALWKRRPAEALAWCASIAIYAVYYAWHAGQVLPRIGPNDLAHGSGWLQFLGLPFVLATSQMNSFLLLGPQWVTAIYLPLAMVGLASWNSPTGERFGLVACAYLASFAIVGQAFNQYWGATFAPLLCFGACRAPAGLVDLWRATSIQPPCRQGSLAEG